MEIRKLSDFPDFPIFPRLFNLYFGIFWQQKMAEIGWINKNPEDM